MADFAFRGTFYLGEAEDDLVSRAEQVMEHLLVIEKYTDGHPVRDAAISLDANARTVEVELAVTADSEADAERLAVMAIRTGFIDFGSTGVEERDTELSVA